MTEIDPAKMELLQQILQKTGLNMDDTISGQTIIGGAGMDLIPKEKDLLLRTPGYELSLSLAPILIGRDPDCNLRFDSMMVSRYHAAIFKFGRHYIVKDLHSTNGLLLNNVRTTYSIVRPGDKIRIGDKMIELLETTVPAYPYLSQCSVLFLDVVGSTKLCEQYGEAFTKYMQSVMDRLSDRILMFWGCPIKNLGDGLMCAFGLWAVPEHKNITAQDNALAFAKFANEYVRKLKDFPSLRIRIGIAYGDVTFVEKDELDVFGDTVNLASRLEYANKNYGTHLMMNETFVQNLSHIEHLREIDTVRVKGKQEPVTIFTTDDKPPAKTSPLGEKGSNETDQLYHAGLEMYRMGRFADALGFFKKAAAFKDPPSLCMEKRIKTILESGLDNNQGEWDGIWSLEK